MSPLSSWGGPWAPGSLACSLGFWAKQFRRRGAGGGRGGAPWILTWQGESGAAFSGSRREARACCLLGMAAKQGTCSEAHRQLSASLLERRPGKSDPPVPWAVPAGCGNWAVAGGAF